MEINKINLDGVEYGLGQGKFIARGTPEIAENSGKSQVNFNLDIPLKEKTFYLMLYYSDEVGEMVSAYFVLSSFTKYFDGVVLRSLCDFYFIGFNEEMNQHIMKCGYFYNSETDENYITITSALDDTFYCTTYDYVIIYELPITLGGTL